MKNKKLIALILAICTCLTAFSGCFECKHKKYSNGVCEKCGAACVHVYENSVCVVCGEECSHNFLNGACVSCDKPCVHNYVDGTCSVCTKKCAHNFINGFCSICDMPCSHNYVNGVCSVCNGECSHIYENSVCTVCGVNCPHDFANGVCKDCSAEDPDYIPEDGGVSLYDEIVDKFKELTLYKSTFETLPERTEGDAYYLDALYEVLYYYDPSIDIGYAFKDIDGDGYVEFLITEDSSRLYAIFTIINKIPTCIRTFQNGLGYLAPDGTIFYNVKNGLIYLENNFSKLVDGELVTFTYGWYDSDENAETDNDIYFTVDEACVETTISKDEYDEYRRKYNGYWSYATRHTRLSGLRFYLAIETASSANKAAAFFDYEIIIDTFTSMATYIAGDGRYAKTKWTSGESDKRMIFLSDEDYYIYNKITAGCVLLQESTTPVFGYALKDLDNNGVDELLLLDNAYNLFAIFTMVDGNAVLLDSYHEWHTAFIDKNGDIHVKDIVFPGREKDAKYSVYEVAGDKLSLKSSILVTHDLTTVSEKLAKPSGWYKAVNGEMVAIEQSEYDSLYEAFAGNLGSATYGEYNQLNAGLAFVSVMPEIQTDGE